MSAKLIVKNKIQITSQKKPITAGEKSQSLVKNLNSLNLNSLSAHFTHNCSLSNSLDRNLHREHPLGNRLHSNHSSDCNSDYNSNYQLADHNRLKANRQAASHNATMAIEKKQLCDDYRLTFNGKLNNNDSDLDNLNAISAHRRTGAQNARQPIRQPQIKPQPIKSTSFESSLTDDYNSEHSTEEIGGCFSMNNADSHSSNLEEDDVSFDADKQPAEMEELLDKRSIKDQKIVEVVSVESDDSCQMLSGESNDSIDRQSAAAEPNLVPNTPNLTRFLPIIQLRQLVRDCTNPDPTKRPSSFQVTKRLQPFLK